MGHKYELWVTWQHHQICLAVAMLSASPVIMWAIRDFGLIAPDRVYTLVEVN